MCKKFLHNTKCTSTPASLTSMRTLFAPPYQQNHCHIRQPKHHSWAYGSYCRSLCVTKLLKPSTIIWHGPTLMAPLWPIHRNMTWPNTHSPSVAQHSWPLCVTRLLSHPQEYDMAHTASIRYHSKRHSRTTTHGLQFLCYASRSSWPSQSIRKLWP